MTVVCDEEATAITCSLCSMIDVVNELGKLSDEELEAITSTKMGIA